jgi:histone H3/H4
MATTNSLEVDMAEKELLVVTTRINALVHELEGNVSGDFTEAVSEKVKQLVELAVARAKSNKRSTVRPSDL